MAPSMKSFSKLLGLAPTTALGANLLASHYSGSIFSLSLTPSNGTGAGSLATLAMSSMLQAGGAMPSWLTLDSATGNLYVNDESEVGTPVLTTLLVHADNSAQLVANATDSPGQVHNSLYGGVDGRGFIAVAQ